MPCGCGKKRKYLVKTKAGTETVVDSLSAAMALIRKEGGNYQPIKV